MYVLDAMKRIAVLLMMASACGGGMAMEMGDDDGSSMGSGSGSGSGAGSGSGSAVDRSNGWRSRSGDLALTYRSSFDGPLGNGSQTPIFTGPAQNWVGTPVIDEAGNLYFTSQTNLVSTDGKGAVRWKVATSFTPGDLVLGPSGDLYVLEASGYHAGDEGHLYAFDTATGTQRDGELTVEGLYHVVMTADGKVFAQTYNETDGYGLAMFGQATGATPTWSKTAGGDRTAISPHGDQLVEVNVGTGSAAPPLDVVALDPATGDQRWHYTLDATLRGPAMAIDDDGSVFVAAGTDSGLHLIHLSKSGDLLSDQATSSARYPSRIVIGPSSLSIASQYVNAYEANGFVLDKRTMSAPANYTAPCGEPTAVDATDAIYWACPGGIQATEMDGTPIGAWPGDTTFQVVIGPAGAYEVPAPYYAGNQLMKLN